MPKCDLNEDTSGGLLLYPATFTGRKDSNTGVF